MTDLYKPRPDRLIRFRFTLRTMFVLMLVLSIPLAWLGVQMKWIRDRREAREWWLEHGASSNFGGFGGDPSRFPAVLRMLGETPAVLLSVEGRKLTSKEDWEYLERFRRLFPEARVEVLTDED